MSLQPFCDLFLLEVTTQESYERGKLQWPLVITVTPFEAFLLDYCHLYWKTEKGNFPVHLDKTLTNEI